MLTIKFGKKQLKIKYATEPTVKSRLTSRLIAFDEKMASGDGSPEKLEDLMVLLSEMILVGVQKLHKDEFGYDYDTLDGKDEQLVKIYDLLDDYLESKDSDVIELYNQLENEMQENGFLAGMIRKLIEANQEERETEKTTEQK